MEIFISWSGELSKNLGEVLTNWIPGVLQFVKPYFTPDDIVKGSRWSSEIAKELQESQIGIIVLTKDNLSNPWIMFEAGALSKQMDKSKICPILFGLEKTDLVGPLVQFQATSFIKEDIKKLVKTINDESGDSKLKDNVLDDVFEMWWPKLDDRVNRVMSKERNEGNTEIRNDREIIEEILALTRMSASKTRREVVEYIDPEVIEELFRIYRLLRQSVGLDDVDVINNLLERMEEPMEHIYSESIRFRRIRVRPERDRRMKVDDIEEVRREEVEKVKKDVKK